MLDKENALMIKDIPENELIREVYARFGLAMYYGQVLELSIVNRLVISDIFNDKYDTDEEADAAVKALISTGTIGSLKNGLVGRGISLTDLADDLERARKIRNFLAHNYFRERALALQERDGQKQMIIELDLATSFLRETGERLAALVTEALTARGVTEDETPEAIETVKRLVTGLPIPGLSPEQAPVVVTKDGYIIGNGNLTRAQPAMHRGETTSPMFVLAVEWEKATDDERTRLVKLEEKLDTGTK